MKSSLKAALVLVMLLFGDLCFGADTPDLPKAFREDIITLMEMTGAKNIGLQMGAMLSNQLLDSIRSKNPDVPEKVIEVVKDEVYRCFEEAMPDLLLQVVPVYGKHLTQEDIRQLIAFYQTDLGKKTLKVLPLVMGETMQIGRAWGQSMGPKLKRRLEARLEKEGLKPH